MSKLPYTAGRVEYETAKKTHTGQSDAPAGTVPPEDVGWSPSGHSLTASLSLPPAPLSHT